VLFIVGLIAIPLLVAILALIGGTRFAAISGGLLVTGEIMLVAGSAIAGKQGYAYIKATVFGFLKKFGPPQKVGKIRYRFGLLIFSYRSFWVGPHRTSENIFLGIPHTRFSMRSSATSCWE
jgi:hypothetical protein